MKLHFLQHVPFEGLGSIERWSKSCGAEVTCTKLFENDQLPSELGMDLLVVMGGPMGVNDEKDYPWLRVEKEFLKNAIASRTKILGVCLGAQLLAQALGAEVFANKEKEIGWLPLEGVPSAANHPIGTILASAGEVFHWHGDTFTLPEGAVHLAQSVGCKNQAFAVGDSVLGFQFHLETTPESARAMIEHCGQEIVEARFIQPGDTMLKDDGKFQRINKLMDACLDCFTGRTG